MRYFAKVDPDGTVWGRLLRFNVDDVKHTLVEEGWNRDTGEWEKLDGTPIMDRLMAGDPLFDEFTEEEARAITPEAFA